MKIGINTLGLNHGQSSLGLYLTSVLENISDFSSDVSIELFGSEVDRYSFGNNNKFVYKGLNLIEGQTFKKNWQKYSISEFIKMNNYDVLFYKAGTFLSYFSRKVKSIVLVHEIISENIKREKSLIYKSRMMSCLKRCTAIISSSEYIKNDLIKLGIKKEKIFVIYPGVDHSSFFPRTDLSSDFVNIEPFSIKKPYFIYPASISNIEKNHESLIKAFSVFKEKTKLPHRLVLAGRDDEYCEKLQKLLENIPYASDIFITGFFPHQSLPDLYSSAEAFVFPSEIEGSGIAVLEAMASGIPVICANAGVIPELTSNKALMFNPNNIEEISSKMEMIVNNVDLRNNLIQDELKIAGKFSWQKNIEQTVELVKQLCK